VGRKPLRIKSLEADIASAITDEAKKRTEDIYENPNVLNQRVLLPKPDNLAEHREASNERRAAIQWIAGTNGNLIPRYVTTSDAGLEVGKALVTLGRQKLAKNDRSDPVRQRYALDLEELETRFFPNMSNKEIEAKAGTKYEYVNARGNEAHHITPISYSGKILNKLEELGIKGPVIEEMLRRKMSIGDTSTNIASLATKAGPGRSFLVDQDKSKTIDKHDQAHAMAEELLELLNLPQQNKGSYRLNDFMDDENVSNYQKQAYAMAVPQAHRLAVQAVLLDPSTEANQKRLLDGIVRLAADNQQSKINLSEYTQSLLRDIHEQAF